MRTSAARSPASIFSAASSRSAGITRLMRPLQPFCNPTARSSLVLAGIAWDGTITIPWHAASLDSTARPMERRHGKPPQGASKDSDVFVRRRPDEEATNKGAATFRASRSSPERRADAGSPTQWWTISPGILGHTCPPSWAASSAGRAPPLHGGNMTPPNEADPVVDEEVAGRERHLRIRAHERTRAGRRGGQLHQRARSPSPARPRSPRAPVPEHTSSYDVAGG